MKPRAQQRRHDVARVQDGARQPSRGRASWLRRDADPAAPPPEWLGRFDACVLALVALLLGWIVTRLHVVGDYSTESDFYGAYAAGARLFQLGAPVPSRYGIIGPGYDAAVALAGFALRDLFLAAKVVSALSALAVLISWRRIARATIGPVGTSWMVPFLATNPVFLRYGCSATTDMLAAALQAACLAMLITGAGWRAWLGAGVLAALACLTRYTSIYLVPVAALLLLVRRRHAAPGFGVALASFLGGFVLVAAPWTAFSLTSAFIPGNGLFGQFGFYVTAGMSRNIQDEFGGLSGATAHVTFLDFVRRDPVDLIRRLVAGVPEHLLRDARELLGWPVAALCGAGLLLALPRGGWRRLLPIVIPGVVLFLTLAPIFYSDRYSLPLAPVYVVFAAVAAASPRLAFELPRYGVPLKMLAVAAVLLVSAGSSAALQRRLLASEPVEVVAAGRALAQLARPGDRVVSRKGHIGYYSGVEAVAFPRVHGLAELAEVARQREARFLYYSWYEAAVRPEVAFLLDSAAVIPGLERVFSTDRQPAVLYRIGPGFGHDSAGPAESIHRQLQQARVLVRVLSDSTVAPYHALLAADALDRVRVAEAIEHAAAAIRWRPRDPVSWTLMGDAQWADGHLEDARLAYANALVLDPRDSRARLGLGRVELQLGQRRAGPAVKR